MKKTTINDIARFAGVSKATVSRVLNGNTSVDLAMRDRVLEAIKQLDYSPSALARNLSFQQSNTIGIIIPEIDNPFYGKILRTVLNLVNHNGYSAICYDTNNEAKQDIRALHLMDENRVCGIIYAPSLEYSDNKDILYKAIKLLEKINIPISLIDRQIPDFSLDGVFYENEQATYQATKLLIAAGHEKIAILNGDLRIDIARERQKGYKKALEESGLLIREDYEFDGDFTEETAYYLAKKMISMQDMPTAVISCNNNSTLGFMKARQELSPWGKCDNIEHIGIDEIEILNYLGIAYNYAGRQVKKMATEAYQILCKRIENPNKEREIIYIQPEFSLNENLETYATDLNIKVLRKKGGEDEYTSNDSINERYL